MHNAYETYQQISKLKIKFKNITIIAGGIHMRHCFDEALRHGVDVVVNREGEKVIVPLLEHLERHGEDYKNDLDLIAGVSFVRQDGRFHFSKEYPAVENLDDVPVVNYELFNIQDFIKTGTEAGLFYFTGQRGCPFKCTFCSDAVHNLDKRCSSADWLFKNVRYLHEKYQVSYLLIADNNFTFPRKRAVEFCRKMIDSGLSKKLTFSCQTNTRFPLDEELVCLMREAGFCRINFGLERLTTYSLQKINKMQPFQGVHDALTLVSKHNIDPSIFMMIGFPFETEELLEQEKELFLDLKKYTHRLFLSVLCPMPGTMYYDGSPKIKEWYLNRDAYLMFRAYFTNVLDMHTFNTIERNF